MNGDIEPENHDEHNNWLEKEVDQISIWKHPVTTLILSIRYICNYFIYLTKKLFNSRLLYLLIIFISFVTYIELSPTNQYVHYWYHYIKNPSIWYSKWIILGFLSSFGFGCGVHTFLLYLGPFVMSVVLAAQECSSIDFPSPPYPHQVICPCEKNGTDHCVDNPSIQLSHVPLMDIFFKIALESFLWGFGTAIGELPPYLMTKKTADHRKDQTSWMGPKIELIVQKLGFWGILIFASFPNPFFDLAGVICGTNKVKFSTFFLATFIGKACIKVLIQVSVVILMFSEHHFEQIITLVPSDFVKVMFVDWLDEFKKQLHSGTVVTKHSTISQIIKFGPPLVIGWSVGSFLNTLAKEQKREDLLKDL
ncbi:hypothetical protein SNEBB_008193 [Seison nebaliae]|nr:hypothetical protein SNEBB_008193 [Seison nebaliae]